MTQPAALCPNCGGPIVFRWSSSVQTTCPHCRTLAIMLEELKAKLPGKVEVLEIVEPPDNTGTVGKFLADNKLTIPIVFDSYLVAQAYFKATPSNPSFDTPHLTGTASYATKTFVSFNCGPSPKPESQSSSNPTSTDYGEVEITGHHGLNGRHQLTGKNVIITPLLPGDHGSNVETQTWRLTGNGGR